MRILITDDDFVSRNVLHAILLPYGRCEMAANGKDAIAAFERAWEEEDPYDLICLDVQMPEMDGHEALKAIREWEANTAVPESNKVKAIMITVARDVQNVMAARQSGCEAYLVKPVGKERLLDELTRLKLRKVRLEDEASLLSR